MACLVWMGEVDPRHIEPVIDLGSKLKTIKGEGQHFGTLLRGERSLDAFAKVLRGIEANTLRRLARVVHDARPFSSTPTTTQQRVMLGWLKGVNYLHQLAARYGVEL